MNLTTKYMGLKLKNPLVAAASPLSYKLDNLAQLEDAGISAVVLHSLFEEQVKIEEKDLNEGLTQGTDTFAESLSYFPELSEFVRAPEQYIDYIKKAKKEIKIPVIGSLNGISAGGWMEYAKKIEEAGADGLELNIFFLPTDPEISGADIEQVFVDILELAKLKIKIPVAVKLNPYFSSLIHVAKRLDSSGADALVLFNRFYQPDIDLEFLEVKPNLMMSTSAEMRLPLRWTAILREQVKASLGASTGIHDAADVIKMLLVGSDATMLCATLLENGIDYVKTILQELEEWMKEHGYNSLEQMKGSMSQKSVNHPEAFIRANYMKELQSFE